MPEKHETTRCIRRHRGGYRCFNAGHHQYRIIFMGRNLEEVIDSQRTMLDHHGCKGRELEKARAAEIFGEQSQKIGRTIEDRGIPRLTVRYSDAIPDSQSVAGRISLFFDGSLDGPAMVAVVDPTLYCEKS